MTQQPRSGPERYIAPDGFTARIFNPTVAWLARRGVSLLGSRELRVRGRTSGAWRTTPVNLLVVEGQRYLVAPRGTTQWVRNIRVAGGGELRVGRRVEQFRIEELPDLAKPPVLREYLRRWWWEVGRLFPGLSKQATDEQVAGIAAQVPVFRIVPV